MARPVWTSKDDPPYAIDGTIVRANQGNWMQGQGGERLVEPRFVFEWYVDGTHVKGEAPPSRSAPDQHFAGEGDSTLDLGRFPAAKTCAFRIHAGNHYTFGEDWYEWGSGNVTSDEPYLVTVTTPPPPPVGTANIPAAAAELKRAISELQASNGYKVAVRDNPSPAALARTHVAVSLAAMRSALRSLQG